MLHELLKIFRPGNPLKKMADEFAEMLSLTCDMTASAGQIYFREPVPPEERTNIYKRDVRVNRLERSIRKRVVAHLSIASNTTHLPYCLLLMGLVKDVERIGDYAKNLSEVPDLYAGELPSDSIMEELQAIREGIEETFREAAEVFLNSDRERAMPLILTGKDLAKRSDGLLTRIAHSNHSAGVTTAYALGVRYYKRIDGHVLNVLSSVVMPLHKVDYYDEKEMPSNLN
jgi:phosphate transport system protein